MIFRFAWKNLLVNIICGSSSASSTFDCSREFGPILPRPISPGAPVVGAPESVVCLKIPLPSILRPSGLLNLERATCAFCSVWPLEYEPLMTPLLSTERFFKKPAAKPSWLCKMVAELLAYCVELVASGVNDVPVPVYLAPKFNSITWLVVSPVVLNGML